MDKQQARNLIKVTFENPFDKNRFTRFIKDLLNKIDDSKAFHARGDVKESFINVIKTYERIGTYNSPNEEKVDIIIVYLQKNFSIDHARVTQRNFAGKYLSDRGQKDAGLFAFVSPDATDWRFSLVKMDYKFEQTKTGRMKVMEEFTPARRWSFLVGANETSHTAQSRLVDMLANDEHSPTLEELEQAFDIETVTKEFFIEYRKLFIRTKEELGKVEKNDAKIKADFEAKGVNTVDFAKKLLGQIVFLYFLQKKGWFGVGRDAEWDAGSKHFLRELFEKKHGGYKNFFNDILEPLFYEALRIDRSHDDDYYSRFNCKIPFLNGGLFDPIGNNGGYNWVHTDICLPDSLFSNKNKTKEGDEGDGILDIFDRYNFTVREDEPLEKEVAIDPELLGKAYEKFNAIRPDNFEEYKKALKSGNKGEESKFNKQYGVYYTPRDIVHYMCQQSLINYLFTECNTPSPLMGEGKGEGVILNEVKNLIPSKEDIEALIHTGEQVSENEEIALIKEQKILEGKQKSSDYKSKLSESIRINAVLIDRKLADIAVCDPAVGSGAFPVGMMSEIVKTRNVLTTFLSPSPNPSHQGRGNYDESPLPLRERDRVRGEDRTIYNFKHECIEKSLYGVDIDPGAVEIAKLRLWLSLVVDEDDIKNIKPLPNLDYRIMQGNSLIEILTPEFLEVAFDQEKKTLITQLRKVKDELFGISSPSLKEIKRKEIGALIAKIIEHDKKAAIEKINLKIRSKKEFYKLLKDKILEEVNKKEMLELEEKIQEIKDLKIPGPSEHFEWHLNFAEVFLEKGGFDVVIANPPYGADLKVIEKNLLDKKFSKLKTSTKNSAIYFIYLSNTLLRANGTNSFIVPKSICYSAGWNKCANFISAHLIKIIDVGKAFENVKLEQVVYVCPKSYTGSTFINGLYENGLITEFKPVHKNLFYKYCVLLAGQTQKEINLILTIIEKNPYRWGDYVRIERGLNWQSLVPKNSGKVPIYRGAHLNRYYLAEPTDFIDLSRFNTKDYEYQLNPKILNQLAIAHVQNPYPHFYLQSILDLDNKLVFETISCTFAKTDMMSLKFLLALNNSKLFAWLLYKFVYSNAIRSTIYDEEYVSKIPCPKLETINQQRYIILVDQILAAKQKDPDADTSALERQIDQMVYKLYDLTPEEITIVEGRK